MKANKSGRWALKEYINGISQPICIFKEAAYEAGNLKMQKTLTYKSWSAANQTAEHDPGENMKNRCTSSKTADVL